jgi:hypothetical protein
VEPSTAPGEEDFALFQQIAIASAKQVTDEPVEAFDAPGPDEMTTRVPPPPPPGSNTTAGEQVDIADDMGAADEEVDPALIARLIQGVKDL